MAGGFVLLRSRFRGKFRYLKTSAQIELKNDQVLNREDLRIVLEGLELQRIARRITYKQGLLLAGLTFKAQIGRDNKVYAR